LAYRIGQGFDVHAFTDGSEVVLGGVTISHVRGLAAHSDGDVALHALCDAMLGAAALGDIGQHFPPDEDRWRDISSRKLVLHVTSLLENEGWAVENVDMTIICERPLLAPHIPEMCKRIAHDLGCSINRVSVKATTTERLGFCGRGEGIAAQAIVLLRST
jgi:2-C-methyl-D-erythritol 2,4-cyclodiphosphate synthase